VLVLMLYILAEGWRAGLDLSPIAGTGCRFLTHAVARMRGKQRLQVLARSARAAALRPLGTESLAPNATMMLKPNKDLNQFLPKQALATGTDRMACPA